MNYSSVLDKAVRSWGNGDISVYSFKDGKKTVELCTAKDVLREEVEGLDMWDDHVCQVEVVRAEAAFELIHKLMLIVEAL